MNKKKKLRKAIFNKYVINLRGRTYEVYEPDAKIDNIWIFYEYSDYYRNMICGPGYFYVWVRHICILLKHNPNAIVHIKMNDNSLIKQIDYCWYNGELMPLASEILFYRHDANLHKTDWFDIKKCIRYTKREKISLKYDLDYEKIDYLNYIKKYGETSYWHGEFSTDLNTWDDPLMCWGYGKWYDKKDNRRRIIKNTIFVCESKLWYLATYHAILEFDSEHGDLGWQFNKERCYWLKDPDRKEFDPEDCIEELRASAKQKKKLKKEQKRLRYKKNLAKMLPKQD